MIKKGTYLGADGDIFKEIRSEYYLLNNKLIVHCWGEPEERNPQEEIKELLESLAILEPFRKHDDYRATVSEIEKLIENLKLNFGG